MKTLFYPEDTGLEMLLQKRRRNTGLLLGLAAACLLSLAGTGLLLSNRDTAGKRLPQRTASHRFQQPVQ